MSSLAERIKPIRVGGLRTLVFALVTVGTVANSNAQPPDQPQQSAADSRALREQLGRQIQLLNSESFRVRQLARWRLEQHPRQAIELARQQLPAANHNAGSQLIDLLTAFAMHRDVEVSLAAIALLQKTATQMSSLGTLARNSLLAIADLQEQQAIEVLVHHEARIGAPAFSINAQRQTRTEMSLHINEAFSGDRKALHWIQFLKSIETIFLEGPGIDSHYFRAIAELKGVRNIKLRHVTVTTEDLQILKGFPQLEHLGLNYVDVDDSAIDLLAELPLSGSLRLYGTKISRAGAKRLQAQLDDIEIYCGKGGFLGISTGRTNTRVSMVTENSGAMLAGIQSGDKLTHINGVELKDFDDIREELANYVAGDEIQVDLLRGTQKLQLKVTLTEDRN